MSNQREIKFRFWEDETMRYPESPRNAFSPSGDHEGIMQYTELKDKKGNEIYEGDILKIKGIKIVRFVAYQKEKARFFLKDFDNDWVDFDLTNWAKMEKEVVGNIYEHRKDFVSKYSNLI